MKKFLASLAILAAILGLIYYKIIILLLAWGITEILIQAVYKRKFFKASLGILAEVIFTLLILFDIVFNVLLAVPMNRLLIERGSYQFGDRKDTISRVLGVNERDNTLKKPGRVIASFLNFIEKDHCKKSI